MTESTHEHRRMSSPPTTSINELGPLPLDYDTVTEAGLGRFIPYVDVSRKRKDLKWKELFTMRCLGTNDADDGLAPGANCKTEFLRVLCTAFSLDRIDIHDGSWACAYLKKMATNGEYNCDAQ